MGIYGSSAYYGGVRMQQGRLKENPYANMPVPLKLVPVAPQSFVHEMREGRFVQVQDARKCYIVFYIREGHSTPEALKELRRRGFKPICVIRASKATTPVSFRMMERAARANDVQPNLRV